VQEFELAKHAQFAGGQHLVSLHSAESDIDKLLRIPDPAELADLGLAFQSSHDKMQSGPSSTEYPIVSRLHERGQLKQQPLKSLIL
jgi:hypothetical protein